MSHVTCSVAQRCDRNAVCGVRYRKLLDRMYSPENEKANYVRYQPSDTAHLTLHPAL